jgi:hypothetical protein
MMSALADSVRNSRQAVINGDYATASVFYNVAIKSCNSPDLSVLKENLIVERNALNELVAGTIQFSNSFEKPAASIVKKTTASKKKEEPKEENGLV